MRAKQRDTNQLTLNTTIEQQIDLHRPLCTLSRVINWNKFETEFKNLYSENMGAPAKPIRLMVGLHILKHLRNLSDESVVEQWGENLYYQYFCGETIFRPQQPCASSELVHFRDRIGSAGMELILQESIRVQTLDSDGNHKPKGSGWKEKEMIADTTVHEKNITFPTDDKLYKKIIGKCVGIAQKEQLELRQSYSRTVRKLSYRQRFRRSKRNMHLARKADKKIKTIAGRLVREMERKLSPEQMSKYSVEIELFKRVLNQKKDDKNKIYSLHEPQTQCISKGKAHKRYEFGSKGSLMIGKESGIIFGALNIEKNDYDGHTLGLAMEQFKRLNGYEPRKIIADLGYRGIKKIGRTEVVTPNMGAGRTKYQKQRQRNEHRRRASIEGKISHVKYDFRMHRNYYKGISGDHINIVLAAAASNFKRWLRIYAESIKKILSDMFGLLVEFFGLSCPKTFASEMETTF